MSTSDGRATPTLPQAPELGGTDVSSALQTPAGFPNVEQLATWANEFFQSADPLLPPTPGTSSGFAIPDPAAHSGRRAPGQPPISPPTAPGFASIAAPAALAADPVIGPQLNLRPDFVSNSFVANPTLGGIDPIGRGPQIPSPQTVGRQVLAGLSPSASPSVPFYFLNQGAGGSVAPAPTNIDLARVHTDPLQLSAAKGLGVAPDHVTEAGRSSGANGAPAANGGGTHAAAPAGFGSQPSAAPASGYDAMRGYDARTTPANVVDLTPSYARTHDRARSSDFTPTHTREQRGAGGTRPVTSSAHHYDPRARDPERPGQFNVDAVRADFPILGERVQGKPLVWLDNAATTQKPQVVIDRLAYFYAHENSNIHRGAHSLAARSTDAYENARESVRRFINAGSTEEIVFVRGATEGINLIANAWGGRYIEAGDEIIVTRIEHHSNIVPWQMLCQRTGATLRVAEVDDTGQVRLDQFERLFNQHTRLVSFTHVSNALGTILPVAAMTQIAHRYGARVVIDGAQSVCHMRVDVQQLDADFYVFSGHKVFGPTGIGAVYGKKALLQAMPPWQGGGNMIGDVTFDKVEYQPPPTRFEAGTGNIADAVGLGAALDYLEGLGMENVARHEHELLAYGTHELLRVPGLHLVGTAAEKAAVLGFVLENVSSIEVGSALAANGIAVRAGHHCAQPALRRFGHETTVRPSLAVYNNRADIDALVATLHDLQTRWLR